MALGYRAFFTVPDPTDLVARTAEQVHSWLRQDKRYDADRLAGAGTQPLSEGVTGLVLAGRIPVGADADRRGQGEDRPVDQRADRAPGRSPW